MNGEDKSAKKVMKFLINVPPQLSLNGRERSPRIMKLGKTQRKKENS